MAGDDDNLPPPEARLLPDCPTDGVSSLSYIRKAPSLLAASSWDGTLRVYDTKTMTLQRSQTMDAGPLLSLATLADGSVVTGGLDGSIRRMILDESSSTPQVIGQHKVSNDPSNKSQDIACSCLSTLPELDLIASAGWHRQFHLWDTRQQSPVATLDLPGKAFAMDADSSNHRVVVATSGRRLCFVDVRKGTVEEPESDQVTVDIVLDRESSLKYQSRAVRFFPGGSGIAVGSIEARVAIEYLEELGVEAKGKKYAFKCHRVGDRVYPVNCIEFHPRYGTFATGGSDGTVGTC